MGSKNRQTTPATTSITAVRQLLGTANEQTAPATTSTGPAHQPLGSANAETTPAGAPAGKMQRPNAVQDPVKKQQPDVMSHRGAMPDN